MKTLAALFMTGVFAVLLTTAAFASAQGNTKSQAPAAANTSKSNGNVTTTTPVEGTFKGGDDGVKVNVDIKADATVTVDCGTEKCFEEKFAACQPATAKADLGFVAYQNRILGPAKGGCKMTSKYTKNPNPAWVNKEMTCIYDNKIDSKKSAENVLNGVLDGTVVCEGPLYDILRSKD